jgi:hypothetical protein
MVVLDTVVLAVEMEQEIIVVTLMFLVEYLVVVLDLMIHINQMVVKEQLELFGVMVDISPTQTRRICLAK